MNSFIHSLCFPLLCSIYCSRHGNEHNPSSCRICSIRKEDKKRKEYIIWYLVETSINYSKVTKTGVLFIIEWWETFLKNWLYCQYLKGTSLGDIVDLGQEGSRQKDNQVQEPLSRSVFPVSREHRKAGETGAERASEGSVRSGGRRAKCGAIARTSGFLLCTLWSQRRIRIGSFYKSPIPALFIGPDITFHTVSAFSDIGLGSTLRHFLALPQTPARISIHYFLSFLSYLEKLPYFSWTIFSICSG